MKDTIREDQNRIVCYEEYLDDNALLEVTPKNENGKHRFEVFLRYITSGVKSIKEVKLTELSEEEFLEEFSNFIEINKEKNAIAIFKKTADAYILDRMYDIVNHSFAPSDFDDVVYGEKFKISNDKVKNYIVRPISK